MAKKYEIDDDHREPVYKTDLTDEEWEIIKPFLLERLSARGAPMEHSLRDILNACFYMTDNGGKWDNLPKEYPDHNLVWYHFNKWSRNGTWAELNRLLYEDVRKKRGAPQRPVRRLWIAKAPKPQKPAVTADLMVIS